MFVMSGILWFVIFVDVMFIFDWCNLDYICEVSFNVDLLIWENYVVYLDKVFVDLENYFWCIY